VRQETIAKAWVERGFGVQGKGAAAPLPLLPYIEQVICLASSNLDLSGGLGSAGDSAYLIVDW
jgi:hypothetical protein